MMVAAFVSAEQEEDEDMRGDIANENDNSVRWNDDGIEDSLFDPLQADPDCTSQVGNDESCWSPPATTVEEARVDGVIKMDASCSFGGDDPDQDRAETCAETSTTATDTTTTTAAIVDQHWGSDPQILRMRNKLRDSGSGVAGLAGESKNRRPPVFLMPGLASTRLVAWRYKACPQHALLSDIKVLDYGTYVGLTMDTPFLRVKTCRTISNHTPYSFHRTSNRFVACIFDFSPLQFG